MSRTRAVLSVLAVVAAAAAAFVVVRRLTAPKPSTAGVVAAEAPVPVAVPAAAPAPATDAVRALAADPEPTEQPLPTWVRVAIVGAALVAFFAVSLIATRNV
jgi:hypothetical protein